MQHVNPLFERFSFLLFPLCLFPVLIFLRAQRKRKQQSRISLQGCKKLGIAGRSNLADEYAPEYSNGSTPGADTGPRSSWAIKALFIYPIKSCAPIEVGVADLSSSGLAWDRQFCFAEYTVPTVFPNGTPDSQKRQRRWTFRSLRKPGYEKLVHIRPEVWVPDPSAVRKKRIGNPNLDGVLVIKYPNLPPGQQQPLKRLLFKACQSLHLLPLENSFQVPLIPPSNHNYPIEPISIWKDIPSALNYGAHIPADFKTYLSIPSTIPFTLFRIHPTTTTTHHRQVHRNKPTQITYQPTIAFADAYPIHLLNLTSVRDLNERVKTQIPHLSALRFRPNIIVSGPPAYNEDDWKKIRVHPHHQNSTSPTTSTSVPKPIPNPTTIPTDFHTACHTLRCRLPNVDPTTSARHPTEPDRTLKAFRCIDTGDPSNAVMGLQLMPARPGGEAGGWAEVEKKEGVEVGMEEEEEKEKRSSTSVSVSDTIEILERGELVYVKA
jgi:uncharacterized protein YcbX